MSTRHQITATAGLVLISAIFVVCLRGYVLLQDRTLPGTTIRWSGRSISYYVNPSGSGLTIDQLLPAIQASFASWSTATNGSLTFIYKGVTTATSDSTDHQNTIFWDVGRTVVPTGNLGRTIVSWDSSGNIYDADIALAVNYGRSTLSPPAGSGCSGGLLGAAVHFGGVPISWSLGQQGIGGAPYFNVYNADVQATVTHEIGHLLGLNHTTAANAVMSTMTGATPGFFCSTDQRNLKGDDVAGATVLYPQPPVAAFSMTSGTASALNGQILNLTVALGATATITFDASASSSPSGATIAGWTWTIDGISPIFPRGPTSSFSQSLAIGNHTVTLSVTDSNGLQSSVVTGTVNIAQSQTGTVTTRATLDGSSWPSSGTGSVSYTISCGTQSINGSAVPQTMNNVAAGQCSLSYTSGGPPSSSFVGVSPSTTQTLVAGSTTVFTMRFTSGAPTAGFTMTFGTQSMTDGQNLSVTVSSGATANVSFDGNTRSSAFNGGAISAWQWTIDSTVVSTAASFSQTLGIGTHNISLIVTDNRAKQSTAALGTVTVSNQGSAGQQYTITDLGSLAGGDTSATAINNNGQVVGWSAVNAGSFFQGFLWTGTAGMVQIGPAPNAQSGYYQPYSLNNTGTAVGRALSLTSGDYASSFDLTHPGSMIAVGTGIPGHANGINNAGQIVGTSFYPNGGFPYAFLWSSSSSLVNLSAQLSLPNNAVSSGDAINNKGQVIINAADPLVWTPGSGIGSTITLSHTSTGVAHAINDFGLVAGTDFPNAVIWNAASNIKTVLGHLPASSFGEALALNNNAVEVGYSGTLSFGSSPQDSSHIATLYSLGTSYDLNSLIPANSGWVLREAVGINDAGQVAGTGVHNGQLRAFLLTPQNPSQVLFSDFGPNDTSSGTGWYEGTGSGTAFLSEMGFTPSGAVGAQFTLDSVEVVVGLVAGTNELDVSILNDNNGLPGATVLESFHFSNAMSPWNNAQHQTLSATSASKPTLVAGTQYWVKVVPTNYSQTVVGWNLTPYDDFGPVYVMGYGLRSDHRGVFRIRGTPR